MLTIFTTPRPFNNDMAIIHQHNALGSWQRLKPLVEVIVLSDDVDGKRLAERYGFRCIGGIKRDSSGTELISNIFELGWFYATSDLVCYLNSDIITPPWFAERAMKIDHRYGPNFLAIGRRYNINIGKEIDYSDDQWYAKLCKKPQKPDNPYGLDFFLHHKFKLQPLPTLTVARWFWDNTVVGCALRNKLKLLDASEVFKVLHPVHGHEHIPVAKLEDLWKHPQGKANLQKLLDLQPGKTKDNVHAYGCPDADIVLKNEDF